MSRVQHVPPENGLPSHGGGQEGKVKEADVVMWGELFGLERIEGAKAKLFRPGAVRASSPLFMME